jgi:hypothetical protein
MMNSLATWWQRLATAKSAEKPEHSALDQAPTLPPSIPDFETELRKVLCRCEGGVFSRLDDIRMVAQELHREHPDWIHSNPHLYSALLAQDDFLSRLSTMVDPAKCKVPPRRDFPRSWPHLKELR